MTHNYSYPALRRYVRHVGSYWKPDGKDCKEVLVAQTSFPMGTVVGRDKMNPRLGFMEGLQLIAGTDSREAVLWAAPKVDISMFTAMSFYGPRVKDQVPTILHELIRDPESRRAVLTVAGDPIQDIPANTEPCTIAVQFLIRGQLYMAAYLRSSDVVWGVPYDVMQFSMLGLAVAACLGVKPGSLHLVGGSTHEYTATRELGWHRPERRFTFGGQLHPVGDNPLDWWRFLVGWAQSNALNPDVNWVDGKPYGVEWVE